MSAQKDRGQPDAAYQPAPEPWVGHVERACILFIGPNSGSNKTPEPPPPGFVHFGSDDALIQQVSADAFDPGPRPRFVDGSRWRDGAGVVRTLRYYHFVYNWARELLGAADPGNDYALTELARCGSASTADLSQSAVDKCSDLYLEQVLWLSPAAVLIVLGQLAQQTMRQRYRLSSEQVVGPTLIEARPRYLVSMPHPGYFRWHPEQTRLRDRLTTDEFTTLETALSS